MSVWRRLGTDLLRALTGTERTPRRPARGPATPCRSGGSSLAPARTAYAGDHTGPVLIDYVPAENGAADPGEVVWAWVPFEEDHTQGKDRPVLVVGREGRNLVALQLTSQDNTRDAAREARFGRYWFDLGPGAWDRQGRPSEVRLDRMLLLAPESVRREGARLDRDRFYAVAAELRRVQGWS